MANRLSQIATRTGDDGTTGLGDGKRLPKSHLRVQALGDVDELNSQLGLLLTEPLPPHIAATREGVQIAISTPLCAATRRWPRRLTRWWWKARAVFTRR